MNIRKINNGIVVRYIDEQGTHQEEAFLFSNTTWKDDAKAFVTAKKSNYADRQERNAHNQIDNIETA